jgi:threonine-phosphate decarboxylase
VIESENRLTAEIPAHGGQLLALSKQFGIPHHELVDFSASIHPVPPSPAVLAALGAYLADPKNLMVYPDTNYSDLKRAIVTYSGVGPSPIVVGNGVMPLLQAVANALKLRRCLILVPAFSEYKRTLIGVGVACNSLVLPEARGFSIDVDQVCAALEETGSDALLLANPHSPSGLLLPSEAMDKLIERTTQLRITAIVDEAFIDYVPQESMAHRVEQFAGFIVLRSLTKFFAIPGLRVAYALAHEKNKADIESCLPLWPVSSPAAEAARLLLEDASWISQAREENIQQREWLAAQLSSLGLHIYPSSANYLLVKDKSPHGIELWNRLITEHRIVTRSCANFEGLDENFLRVGVRSRNENERLVAACAQVVRTY